MELTFEETLSKFDRLIRFMSGRFVPLTEVYDKSDFYQEGQIILFDCYNKYKEKPFEEFKTLFSVSLKRLFLNKIKKAQEEVENTKSYNNFMDFDDGRSEDTTYESIFGKIDDSLNNIYIQEGLLQLKELLSDNVVALAILEELLEPSPRTIWEFNMDKARRKMLHNQGHEEIRLTVSLDIRMHHIARALEISLNDLNKGLKEIREQAYNVFK